MLKLSIWHWHSIIGRNVCDLQPGNEQAYYLQKPRIIRERGRPVMFNLPVKSVTGCWGVPRFTIFFCTCVTILTAGITTWWRHHMEIFSALLAICAGNSPIPGEFPAQRSATQSFDVMFSLICVWINGWVNYRKAGDLRRYRAHYDVIIVMSLDSCTSCTNKSIIAWHLMIIWIFRYGATSTKKF